MLVLNDDIKVRFDFEEKLECIHIINGEQEYIFSCVKEV